MPQRTLKTQLSELTLWKSVTSLRTHNIYTCANCQLRPWVASCRLMKSGGLFLESLLRAPNNSIRSLPKTGLLLFLLPSCHPSLLYLMTQTSSTSQHCSTFSSNCSKAVWTIRQNFYCLKVYSWNIKIIFFSSPATILTGLLKRIAVRNVHWWRHFVDGRDLHWRRIIAW